MDALLQTDKYGAINTIDTTTMGYYVIKFVSDSYTLQEETTCDVIIINSGELVVKSRCMKCIQYNTNCNW